MQTGRNQVWGQIKQGGGLYSALGPCVCHLCHRGLVAGGVQVLGLEAFKD